MVPAGRPVGNCKWMNSSKQLSRDWSSEKLEWVAYMHPAACMLDEMEAELAPERVISTLSLTSSCHSIESASSSCSYSYTSFSRHQHHQAFRRVSGTRADVCICLHLLTGSINLHSHFYSWFVDRWSIFSNRKWVCSNKHRYLFIFLLLINLHCIL